MLIRGGEIEEFHQTTKKPRMSKSKIKTMLICFFDIKDIHFKFVPERTTVNQTFYVEVLKMLVDAMIGKQGKLWRDRSLILHHGNMPAHSVFSRKRHLHHGSSAILS
jgi:hypothetical protein